jgi:hypothetical protein
MPTSHLLSCTVMILYINISANSTLKATFFNCYSTIQGGIKTHNSALSELRGLELQVQYFFTYIFPKVFKPIYCVLSNNLVFNIRVSHCLSHLRDSFPSYLLHMFYHNLPPLFSVIRLCILLHCSVYLLYYSSLWHSITLLCTELSCIFEMCCNVIRPVHYVLFCLTQ